MLPLEGCFNIFCMCFVYSFSEISNRVCKDQNDSKVFHNRGFLAWYHRQNAYVAPYLIRKESGVVS
jgi:hypothetical protein